MINIYVSRDISKNSILFKRIGENLDEGILSYYFVPDQYTLFSDINLIEYLGLDVLMDAKVKSFSSFSNEILSKHGGLKKQVLTENGKNMVIQKVLSDRAKDLKVLSKSISTRGFASEVNKSISEFKEAGISPDKLDQALGELDYYNKAKLEDLSLIYRSYEKQIEGEYIDSNDRLNLLYDRLDQATELRDRDFFFDKYNSLNNQELAIIEKLHLMGCQLNFFLILDPRLVGSAYVDSIEDGEVFESSYALFKKLRKIDDTGQIYVDKGKGTDNFSLLADNIFSYRPSSYKKEVEDISIIQCKSTEDEVKFVCERIKAYIIEKDYKYKDFTIITSNEDEYNPFIRKIFNSDGIPYFIDSKQAMMDNKLASFIVNTLLIITRNFRPEDITSFLKFGFDYIPRDQLELFEEFLVTRSIRGRMIFDDSYFSLDADYLDSLKSQDKARLIDQIQVVNQVRLEFLDIIGSYYEKSLEKASLDDHIRNFFTFLYSDRVYESISSFLKGQAADEELNSYNEQTWNFFIDTINEMSDIQGEEELSFQAFAEILLAGFEDRSIGLIPPYQDVVVVGSLQRTRSNASRVMFILGLNDNYFPTKLNLSSLVDDSEREILNQEGLDLPLVEANFKSEEYLNLYSNILKAKEKLYISSSLMDSENRVLTESMYYRKIGQIFPELRPINSIDFFENIAYSQSLLTQDLIVNLEDKLSQPQALSYKDRALLNYLHDKEEASLRPALKRLQARPEQISNYSKLYAADKLSVSRIQSFARCPYKHFIRYGLRPNENIDYSIEKREIGNLAHRSLANFIDSYKEDPLRYKDMGEEELDQEISSLLDTAAEESIDAKRLANDKNQILLDIAKMNLSVGIKNVHRQLQKSKFTPVETELSFAEEGKVPPLILDVDGEKYELEGFIDRVDAYRDKGQDNIIVIDYKTGSQEFNLTFTVNGLDIQLPIYLYAATSSRPGQRGAGFFYLPIKDEFINSESDDPDKISKELIKKLRMDGVAIQDMDILKAMDIDMDRNSSVIAFKGQYSKDPLTRDNILSERDLNSLIQTVLDETKKNIGRIYSGQIQARPYIHDSTSECTNCDFQNICKFDLDKDKVYRPIKDADWSDFKNE